MVGCCRRVVINSYQNLSNEVQLVSQELGLLTNGN